MSTKSIRKKNTYKKYKCNYHYISLQNFVSKNLYKKKEKKRILMVSIWRARDMQSVSCYLQGMFHNSCSLQIY